MNSVIVDECVYSKIDENISAKYNATIQTCSLRSDVHARYQKELEIYCCRCKHEINCLNRIYGLYFASQDQMRLENKKERYCNLNKLGFFHPMLEKVFSLIKFCFPILIFILYKYFEFFCNEIINC